MQKLQEYDFSQFPSYAFYIVFLNKNQCIINDEDYNVVLYDLIRSEITKIFDGIEISGVAKLFNNHIISASFSNRAIQLWNPVNCHVLKEFPFLREHTASFDITHDYYVCLDSGYIGCSRYKNVDGEYTRLERLKLNGEALNSIKIDKDRFYAKTREGCLISTNIANPRKPKKANINASFYGNIEITENEILIADKDNQIRLINKEYFKKQRLFKEHTREILQISRLGDLIYSIAGTQSSVKETIIWDPLTLDVNAKIYFPKECKLIKIVDDTLFTYRDDQKKLESYKIDNLDEYFEFIATDTSPPEDTIYL